MYENLKKDVENYLGRWDESMTEEEFKDSLGDVINYGCAGGTVSGLIYYKDTTAFYEKHKAAINTLLSDVLLATNLCPEDLFSGKWEAGDPLALETNNQNLLAWFGFEEAASMVAIDLGWEV